MSIAKSPPRKERTRKRAIEMPPAGQRRQSSIRVLRQFRKIFGAVKSQFQRVEKVSGLGGSQMWALSVIGGSPHLGVTELADAMDIRQSTASNLIKGLVDRGLVAMTKHPTDRRAVQLSLLPGAEQLLESAPDPVIAILPMALTILDDATLARLEADLGSLLNLMKADQKSAHIPLSDLVKPSRR